MLIGLKRKVPPGADEKFLHLGVFEGSALATTIQGGKENLPNRQARQALADLRLPQLYSSAAPFPHRDSQTTRLPLLSLVPGF